MDGTLFGEKGTFYREDIHSGEGAFSVKEAV